MHLTSSDSWTTADGLTVPTLFRSQTGVDSNEMLGDSRRGSVPATVGRRSEGDVDGDCRTIARDRSSSTSPSFDEDHRHRNMNATTIQVYRRVMPLCKTDNSDDVITRKSRDGDLDAAMSRRTELLVTPTTTMNSMTSTDDTTDVTTCRRWFKFSIAEILKPDFGVKRSNSITGNGASTSNEDIHRASCSRRRRVDNDSLDDDDDKKVEISRRRRCSASATTDAGRRIESPSAASALGSRIRGTGDGQEETSTSCGQRTSGNISASTAVDGTLASPHQQPSLPAWVFCTRYSDRPSAGKL